VQGLDRGQIKVYMLKMFSIEWGSSVRFEHRTFWKNWIPKNFSTVWRTYWRGIFKKKYLPFTIFLLL